METKRVFKFFTAWNLEKKKLFTKDASARLGITKYNLMYTFQKTEPKDVMYKADFRLVYRDSKEQQQEYFEIYEMSGWKRVTSFTRWNYFCKEVEEVNELPDIYSEKETRIQKLNELLLFLVIISASLLPSMYNLF